MFPYISRIDQRTMAEILQSYYENMPKELQPDIIGEIYQQRNGDFAAHADYVFSNSILADSNRYKKFAKKFDVEESHKQRIGRVFLGFLYIEFLRKLLITIRICQDRIGEHIVRMCRKI
ncbi:MAG: hypothetical protein AAFY70_04635, partial [Bacteroidota bacterium]